MGGVMGKDVPNWVFWIIGLIALVGMSYGLFTAYSANEEREGRRHNQWRELYGTDR